MSNLISEGGGILVNLLSLGKSAQSWGSSLFYFLFGSFEKVNMGPFNHVCYCDHPCPYHCLWADLMASFE